MINTITTGDARELAKAIPDESIDLIFTDPPYPKEYLYLYEWLAKEAARVLKPDGHLLVYVGHFYLPTVMAWLEQHLTYHWQYISFQPGQSVLVHPRKILEGYKPILSYSRNKGLPRRYTSDVWTSPLPDKRYHKWGQSELTARYFIDSFSSPGDLIWEPFTGGGTTPIACKALNRDFIAFEIDPDTADIARKRLETVQPLLMPEEMEQPNMWNAEGEVSYAS